jgi:Tfp pilus assembly protein PilZ
MAEGGGRRTEVRFDLVFPVVVEGIFGICHCVARNISAGGMFLETQDPYPLGSTISIIFEVPGGGTTIVARGEVKHSFRISYGSPDGARTIRGIGVKFQAFEHGEIVPHLRSVPS